MYRRSLPKLFYRVLLLLTISCVMVKAQHLLISEVAITPTKGEFIEIANPTDAPVVLTNYYLSDSQEYAVLPGLYGAGPQPVIGSRDFIARFPDGAILAPGEVIVIAIDGNLFFRGYDIHADYEVYASDSVATDMTIMLDGGDADISNGGEGISLFYWDGQSDLVADIDLVNVGTPSVGNQIRNKTAVQVDGPDADLLPSQYAQDAYTLGDLLSDPESGFSAKRLRIEGEFEDSTGGNGFSGHDETSEQLLYTWGNLFTEVTPGTAAFIDDGSGTPPIISTILRDQVVPIDGSVLTVTGFVSDLNQSIEYVNLHYLSEGIEDSTSMIALGNDIFEAQIPAVINRDEVKVSYWVTARNSVGLNSISPTWSYLAGTTRISEARLYDNQGFNLHSGTACRLKSIASVATNVFANANHEFYIQDGAGGIKVFELNANGEEVCAGDSVEVVGMLFQRFGELEIGDPEISYSVYDTSGTPPIPQPLTISQIDESLECTLIRFTNLEKHAGDWPEPGNNGTVTLVSVDSQYIDLFIDRDTDIEDSPEPEYPIDVIGLLGQRKTSPPYLGDYLIKPRSRDDIQRSGTVIVINEIMYHPPPQVGNSFTHSYFELTNISNESFDLSDWQLSSDIHYKFPAGAQIAPGEYLVVAREPDSISAYYGISGVLGPMHGDFSHQGMSIVLKDRWGIAADSVHYFSQAPWPAAANGQGPSLELRNPFEDNAKAINWAVNDTTGGQYGTPGSGNRPLSVQSPPAQNIEVFDLRQNYPNPFNPTTTIQFELPVASRVTIDIYDILGRHVVGAYRNMPLPAGTHQFIWDATDAAGNSLASGIYFYRLQAGEFVKSRRMILLR